MQELEIIKNCKRTDRKSQEVLYLRFADGMFRTALRYLKNEDDAQDILVMAFNKIFKSINNFNYLGEGSLESWIRRIVINEALMWLRKRHNFNLNESLDDSCAEPDLTDLSRLEAEDIIEIINRLPTGYRTVFNLHVIEGYSHDEISAMLNISEGTSRSQLFKAKAILKKVLTREGYSYGT